MTDLTVKYFNSGMTGAPQIANNWGDLVTMLDACLVNGFALKAIDTLSVRHDKREQIVEGKHEQKILDEYTTRRFASPRNEDND